ncbi:uncharacterized protein LOC131647922 [Vicia villosa]|uniref:uncharacterized protein LOC131630612 n=1 Tax=Vicia villosa TaxID=3911 RepID=UPI00273C8402|nr:uncharacterized protein LOC131630612 [Vicia villosa]XP_058773724.1 uncharacterized protein LOC131647922 [Vicia villosa]
MASPTIQLKTVDGVVFDMERSIALKMNQVQDALKDLPEGASLSSPLPFYNYVYELQLSQIKDYYQKQTEEEKDEFVESMSDGELKNLLKALHFLDMKDFYNFLTNATAKRLEKKGVREFPAVMS